MIGPAVLQLLVAQQTMGHAGMLLMLGITALTAINTFNGAFVTLSRFVYALAREGNTAAGIHPAQLPRSTGRLGLDHRPSGLVPLTVAPVCVVRNPRPPASDRARGAAST